MGVLMRCIAEVYHQVYLLSGDEASVSRIHTTLSAPAAVYQTGVWSYDLIKV